MEVSPEIIKELRRERGWSQEQLAQISGLSARTVQRVETTGECALDSKMALASAFEISPTELGRNDVEDRLEMGAGFDWHGVIGLLLVLIFFPITAYALTSTSGLWELTCLLIVDGLALVLTAITYGFDSTVRFFSHTLNPQKNLKSRYHFTHLIQHARVVCHNLYAIAVIAGLIYVLVRLIHFSDVALNPKKLFAEAMTPLLYAILLAELWVRPYKHRIESRLEAFLQRSSSLVNT